VEISNRIANQPGKTALEKYVTLFREVQQRRSQNREKFYFLSVMMVSEKNILFAHRFLQRIIHLTKEPYARILEQGKKSGEFNIDDPYETAELILHFGTIYRTKLWKSFLGLKENPENIAEIRKLIHFMQYTMERVLGIPHGTLSFISESFSTLLHKE
jgi:hypothetical protein